MTKGADHFTILGPANALLASKILGDKGDECSIKISGEEIAIAVALTLAAVVFVISAIHGRAPETASISAPQGALENPSN